MSEDIEKLKEAAFKLAEMCRENNPIWTQVRRDELIATIEAFKPKVEPLECWVNVYPGARHAFHALKVSAYINLREDGRTVHLREVTPVEWERWGGYGHTIYRGSVYVGNAGDITLANEIADAHNAEMQRVTGTEGK